MIDANKYIYTAFFMLFKASSKQFMLLSLHGQTKDALHKNGLGNWEYDIVAPSYKCNMTDIQAAIGLLQLDRYEGLLKRRRDIIERYDEAFEPLGLLTVPHFTDRHTSSGHLYLLRIPDVYKRQPIWCCSVYADLQEALLYAGYCMSVL